MNPLIKLADLPGRRTARYYRRAGETRIYNYAGIPHASSELVFKAFTDPGLYVQGWDRGELR